jgi:hypothetical protein
LENTKRKVMKNKLQNPEQISSLPSIFKISHYPSAFEEHLYITTVYDFERKNRSV